MNFPKYVFPHEQDFIYIRCNSDPDVNITMSCQMTVNKNNQEVNALTINDDDGDNGVSFSMVKTNKSVAELVKKIEYYANNRDVEFEDCEITVETGIFDDWYVDFRFSGSDEILVSIYDDENGDLELLYKGKQAYKFMDAFLHIKEKVHESNVDLVQCNLENIEELKENKEDYEWFVDDNKEYLNVDNLI